mmetsp:Transcript_30020/g.96870  ORF Transcript_30020/g.96870 Transcript_30020/m.96870 type:complete len:173 (-) Transcript_30020:74-592(-)
MASVVKQKRTCVVCEAGDAKYSCPKCREAYCCVACCKAHKEACSGKAPAKTPKRIRPPPRAERTRDEFDDDEHLLSADLREKLDTLTYVRRELEADSDLLDAFRSVDTAPCRAAALARARTTDLKLAAFIDRVLVDLGLCERDPTTGDVSFLGRPMATTLPPAEGRNSAASH